MYWKLVTPSLAFDSAQHGRSGSFLHTAHKKPVLDVRHFDAGVPVVG